ncbi:hypothetical protein NDU88_005354 [Pleurodeles waltl]|uniref:Uncharacterized protein n=1 Tax=Pleurodeles waltl TaxID=8319 RepID=A0AAV7MXS7_PLEWA|nr:hypothetical protein NDU88_005354 [Pleurodeles waltl]
MPRAYRLASVAWLNLPSHKRVPSLRCRPAIVFGLRSPQFEGPLHPKAQFQAQAAQSPASGPSARVLHHRTRTSRSTPPFPAGPLQSLPHPPLLHSPAPGGSAPGPNSTELNFGAPSMRTPSPSAHQAARIASPHGALQVASRSHQRPTSVRPHRLRDALCARPVAPPYTAHSAFFMRSTVPQPLSTALLSPGHPCSNSHPVYLFSLPCLTASLQPRYHGLSGRDAFLPGPRFPAKSRPITHLQYLSANS